MNSSALQLNKTKLKTGKDSKGKIICHKCFPVF